MERFLFRTDLHMNSETSEGCSRADVIPPRAVYQLTSYEAVNMIHLTARLRC